MCGVYTSPSLQCIWAPLLTLIERKVAFVLQTIYPQSGFLWELETNFFQKAKSPIENYGESWVQIESPIKRYFYINLWLHQVNNECLELMRHPLVISLLNDKWDQFGGYLYLANLLLFGLFVVFLTTFALTVPSPQQDYCESQLFTHYI